MASCLMAERPTEKELDELCRAIYEIPGGSKWDYMSSLSPTLRKITRLSAIRVWKHYQKKEILKELL